MVTSAGARSHPAGGTGQRQSLRLRSPLLGSRASFTVRNREGTEIPPARWEHFVLKFAGIIAVWGELVDIRRAILSKVDQFENNLDAGFIMFILD